MERKFSIIISASGEFYSLVLSSYNEELVTETQTVDTEQGQVEQETTILTKTNIVSSVKTNITLEECMIQTQAFIDNPVE